MSARRILSLVFLGLLLIVVGCSGEGSKLPKMQAPAAVPASFETSIPYDGQDQLPLSAHVVLFFNEPIDPDSARGLARLERVGDDGRARGVAFRQETGTQTIHLYPQELLLGNTVYRVRLAPGLRTADGRTFALPDRSALVSFRTRGDRPLANTAPRLVRLWPDSEWVRDFSTFHLYFDEPLDPDTVQPGRTVYLEDVDAEEPVPCRVLAKFTQIVLDPLSDLAPGKTYRIVVTRGVKDLDGDGLAEAVEREVVPIATRPHHPLVVEACPTAGSLSSCEKVSPAELPTSRLTGQPVNSMLTSGKVLGESLTYLTGPMFASLGESQRPEADRIPVVLRAGQALKATNLRALLGGEIPSGLETGEITVTLLSDAVGFIEDARQDAQTPGLRPRVKLVMDAALNAADPKANASFSQAILGVELSGFSYVDPATGIMTMELGGMAEVFIMGERVASLMTMHQTAPDLFPEEKPDTTPPDVLTTTPMDGETLVATETPIVVQFNEPVNPDTIHAGVGLFDDAGNPVEARRRAEGGKVVLFPLEPLAEFAGYEIRVTSDVRDEAGNPVAAPLSTSFTTNRQGYSEAPPRVGTTAPANEYGATFPANLEPMLFFTAAIEPGTVIYGESVRILDQATGDLVEATPVVEPHKILLRPARYFTPGRPYRIELTAGIASPGGVLLDTDNDLQAGGQPFQLDFVAAEYLDAVPLILHAAPVADRDGDGEFLDETATPENQIKIDSILILGTSYVSGDLVSYAYGLSKTADGRTYLDVKIGSGTKLFATSVGLDVDKLLEILGLYNPKGGGAITVITPVDMGLITIDVLHEGAAPISYDEREGLAAMDIAMDTYFSVANGLFNALLTHELALEQRGLLYFSDDGRMEVRITGTAEIKMLDLISLPSIVTMRAVSDPL